MTTGSTRSYKNGPKNNWRRTVWNEVLSRTRGREKAHPILYLAGPEDLDREIAISKGVPAENLIAIDRVGANVRRVRRGGSLAVQADALDLLWSWPASRPVAAVMLDLCAGLNADTSSLYDPLERSPFRGAVVMVNFMRGRDGWSNEIRAELKRHHVVSSRHRGEQFLAYHAWDVASMVVLGNRPQVDGKREFADLGDSFTRTMVHRMVDRVMQPVYLSYRSGRLRFDSAVFYSHARGMDLLSDCQDKQEPSVYEREYTIPALARRVAATMAIRTMRLRGRWHA